MSKIAWSSDQCALMMVYLIGPDGLVNWRFANFHKMVWMTMEHEYIAKIIFLGVPVLDPLISVVHLWNDKGRFHRPVWRTCS